MVGWMDGWMGGWVDGWIEGSTGGWNVQMDGSVAGQVGDAWVMDRLTVRTKRASAVILDPSLVTWSPWDSRPSHPHTRDPAVGGEPQSLRTRPLVAAFSHLGAAHASLWQARGRTCPCRLSPASAAASRPTPVHFALEALLFSGSAHPGQAPYPLFCNTAQLL